ncbi:MAG: hypothetical protein OXM54_15385 [Acidimicrobiaceae bacterium]|nr:hypothetical protein [Acidimicrobiaceae bacterium]
MSTEGGEELAMPVSMAFAQQRCGVGTRHDLPDGETDLLECAPVAQRCHRITR